MMGADANRRGRDEDSRLETKIVCETCEQSVWESWECHGERSLLHGSLAVGRAVVSCKI